MTEQRPEVEYYFSFISLWSYVGSLVFQDIVKRHDIRVEFKPIDLLAVFAAGAASRFANGRRSGRLTDLSRWRAGKISGAFRW
jgi:2-hydroxychromene-2-carboxylate isomerase